MQTEKEMEFQQVVQDAGERFVESAREMLAKLRAADEDEDLIDAAQREIYEYPLSVLTRSGWRYPGSEPKADEEFEILLGTGGPASRIVGDLDEGGQPVVARYEYQDWFKPWTEARLSDEQRDVLLDFASQFYFGG